jgi:hypothetical protein
LLLCFIFIFFFLFPLYYHFFHYYPFCYCVLLLTLRFEEATPDKLGKAAVVREIAFGTTKGTQTVSVSFLSAFFS